MNHTHDDQSPNAAVNLRRRLLMRTGPVAALAWAGGIGGISGISGHALAAAAAAAPAAGGDDAGAGADPWRQAQAIIDRFAQPPVFRQQDFPITTFGAVGCLLEPVKAMTGHAGYGNVDSPVADAADCYPAISAAIAACNKAGGGRVLIPAGNWYCAGPIVLLSNVHVHLEAGAQVYFSVNPADYARHGTFPCGPQGNLVLSRWQSNDCLNFSPLVYAYGQDNIALTGADWTSILNGQGGVPFKDTGDCWWSWGVRNKGSRPSESQHAANPLNPARLEGVAAASQPSAQGASNWSADESYLPALSEAQVAAERRIFGLGHFLRPCMIQLIGCSNVLLKGYQVNASPFWQHNPINCRNLQIRDVQMNSMGPNNDGFDPESCDQVLVDGCLFNTGDDCIAIKSGKNRDTQFGPSQNIVIQNCVMNSGHGGLTLGSEMSGGIRNVFAQHLEFRNIHWATSPLSTAIRLKTNMNRGGYLKHLYVRHVTIPNGVQTSPGFYTPLPGSAMRPKTVSTSGGAIVTFDCDYAPGADALRGRPPEVSDVHISDVNVGNVALRGGQYSCYQAMVMLGPVATSYNGAAPLPVLPISRVSISDCRFGTPFNTDQPWFLHNVRGLVLRNVTIGATVYNTTLDADGATPA